MKPREKAWSYVVFMLTVPREDMRAMLRTAQINLRERREHLYRYPESGVRHEARAISKLLSEMHYTIDDPKLVIEPMHPGAKSLMDLFHPAGVIKSPKAYVAALQAGGVQQPRHQEPYQPPDKPTPTLRADRDKARHDRDRALKNTPTETEGR